MARTVIYEVHVKGFTSTHPDIPDELRGTYAGLAHPAAIEHLQRLGVTAVELLPVHQFVHDSRLRDRGLRNYWGYNSIGYFAPHNEYAAAASAASRCRSSSRWSRRCTRPASRSSSTSSTTTPPRATTSGRRCRFKGIDNAAYYRLVPDDRRYYMDYTGTGNTLNMRHPHVLQLIMDSLRYWVTEMHVDGFRFDLAATLARELHEVDRLSAFFDLIQQDPVVSQVKLIAEPWDVGEGGYQVGNFPPLWSEWNGKYRDTVRDFWRGDRPDARPSSPTGSPAAPTSTKATARQPYASINFVTAHDGFTLRDLVSLQRQAQRGERRGQPRRREPQPLVELRRRRADRRSRRQRAARAPAAQLPRRRCCCRRACRCCSAATSSAARSTATTTPTARTTSSPGSTGPAPTSGCSQFTRRLIRLRQPPSRVPPPPLVPGARAARPSVADIGWFTPAGTEMTDEDWQVGFAKSLGVFLNGEAIPTPNERGERVVDDSFYCCSTPTTSRSSSACRPRRGARSGRRCSIPSRARTRCRRSGSGGSSGPAAPSRCRPGRSCCYGGLRYLTRDHDLGRLDDGQRFVAATELELVDGVARDDRGQRLIADSQAYLGKQSLAAHFLDDSAQLVAAAERDDGAGVGPRRGRHRLSARRQQPFDF